MLSPWSLSEYDYPDTAPLVIRKRHDPLSQLPRVYVPETPTRNGGYPFERETHIPQVESKESLIDPFMLEPKEPLEELRDVVVRIAREHRSDIDRNVFVIGNEWDSGSDDGSFDELKL